MKRTPQHSIWKLVLLIGILIPVVGRTQVADSTYKKFNLSLGYGLVSYFHSPNQEVTMYYVSDSINNIRSSQTDIVVTDVKIKPLFLRFDYKWDKKNSIGFMATYNGYRASGTRTDSIWNSTSSSYDISSKGIFYSMNRLRFQVVYTRHFFVDRPKVNTYFYTALGVNLKFSKFREDDQEGVPGDSSFDLSRGFPIASRLCYGLRYNFSKNMSLLTEVGLGGPLLSIGLTAKF
ncbi:MAG: hypothetical protein K0S23_1468 [Fluviicola sp.]|jgi:hypothetical protein|uniref:hypothetical protein n=1 Tax=Fluviicola sp. TaxID=1917219 RepID=UPI0026054EDE|nr:hypothetical protein [Fluviicola sp.]MDF3027161.1 hypothetical protein [Fluviicola sp.]